MRRDETRRHELDSRRVKPVPDSPRLVHYPGVVDAAALRGMGIISDAAAIGDMAAVGDMAIVTYETHAFRPGQYICTLRCE